MNRLEKLETKLRFLYDHVEPGRAADWATWLADNHVWVAADYATDLAKRYDANEELARVAALLHDVADVKMNRGDEHEAESLRLARELMHEAGYDEAEVKLVVDDAIRYHGCHGDERPASVEGQILATADSLAHLKTDFYVYATWAFSRDGRSLEEIKAWTLKNVISAPRCFLTMCARRRSPITS